MSMYDAKGWIASAVIVAVVAIWDFNARIAGNEIAAVNDKSVETLSFTENSKVERQELREILALYAAYDIPKKKDEPTNKRKQPARNGPSEAEQSKQKGKLEQLYIGNKKYQLLGVFSDGSQFAVLSSHDIETKHSKEQKVTKGDMLGQYRVTNITDTRVFLTADSRKIELVVFK